MKSMKTIKQKVTLPAPPDRVMHAWLDSAEHSRMTGARAEINPVVGGVFSAWDGTITGTTLLIDPQQHALEQSWRYDYDGWPFNEPSRLRLVFKPLHGGRTKLIMEHTLVPDRYAKDIEDGWHEYYWKPMQIYFSQAAGGAAEE